jgi:hypothetical protein
LPIGGVARLDRMPDDPKRELVVAFAGPVVNVVLAAALFLLIPSTTSPTILGELQQIGDDIVAKLAWVNVGLAAFNLIPAFPMDGGRMLRALLALRMDYVRATNVAAEVGRGLALMFGLVGLFANPLLIFIALFVWAGATAEAGMVQLRSALDSIPVNRAMVTQFETLAPGDTLQRAMEHVLAGFQHDFPVVEADRVVGVLTRSDGTPVGAALGSQGLRVAEQRGRPPPSRLRHPCRIAHPPKRSTRTESYWSPSREYTLRAFHSIQPFEPNCSAALIWARISAAPNGRRSNA